MTVTAQAADYIFFKRILKFETKVSAFFVVGDGISFIANSCVAS